MFQAQINHNLGKLQFALNEYSRVNAKKSSLDALAKNMTKLAFFLREELLKLAPNPQEIADVAAIIQRTGGYVIRKSIAASVLKRVDKRTKTGRVAKSSLDIYGAYDLAIKKEVKARQNAINFLGRSALLTHSSPLITRARNKRGQELSRGETKFEGQDAVTSINWGDKISYSSGQAAEGIKEQRGQYALKVALERTVADLMVYIEKKQREAIGNALRTK